MARASRYGGPSHTPAELADPDLPVRIRRAEIGFVDRQEVEPSVGTHSSQSSKSGKTSDNRSSHSLPQPAPTTENPSSQPEQETGSDAHSTDTDGQKVTGRQSARKRAAPRVRSTDEFEEDDEFFN